MAIKHVVTDGLGFTVPSYLLTDGIGNFSAGAGVVVGAGYSTGSSVRLKRRRRALVAAILPMLLLLIA
jgi:hypothetical protein